MHTYTNKKVSLALTEEEVWTGQIHPMSFPESSGESIPSLHLQLQGFVSTKYNFLAFFWSDKNTQERGVAL